MVPEFQAGAGRLGPAMSCVFCKIAHGEAPAHVVWQDDLFLAFQQAEMAARIRELLPVTGD